MGRFHLINNQNFPKFDLTSCRQNIQIQKGILLNQLILMFLFELKLFVLFGEIIKFSLNDPAKLSKEFKLSLSLNK